MASGNFLIGERLSLEGFKEYVQPILKERGYSVKDRLATPYVIHEGCILASIVGEGDLEKGINDVLVESTKVIDKKESERRKQSMSMIHPIAWSYQVSTFSHSEGKEGEERVNIYKGQFQTIGIYQADETASQLFPLIAQEYLLEGVKEKADEVVQQIRDLLDTKVSDL
ncbi:MAG: hypothetical protein KKF46_03190 [Nanoarchaeota archaeon]|nr:hypothetical protein [Nanoarchaeota archaeon]MBU1321338.1 hypothetical protein [Nanoarchaeota archaeon]MBU1597261.1 hypothetical protein [Nanoarchaeota archaeon]MBU2441475.1 hypothetical protein [Nanoarchaeota archaeon]